MSIEEMSQDDFDQDNFNQEMLLNIFYNSKGSIDSINAAIDAKIYGTRTRSISFFEKFVRARLTLDPKVLRLVDLEITPFEVIYLSQYPGLENVEELDLRKNQLGDKGLDALLHSDKLDSILKLDLRNNQITRKGMEALAKTKKLEKLEKLDLRSNKIGKAWETKLISIGKFPNLSSLKTV